MERLYLNTCVYYLMKLMQLYFLLSIIEPILLFNNLYTNSFTTKLRPKRYSFASQLLEFYRL